ncbi:hypothetical protein BpHYR1_053270 [Brachionus plicatilis]|uniref:Uncharacterized protein n=1 Tax=Brachionus plicatilis TaxID=10195 RepID=A0A3M7T145_BRAPC|nr:hypothetical protein BpHYR1_053270 [Brachionus plicatilis]
MGNLLYSTFFNFFKLFQLLSIKLLQLFQLFNYYKKFLSLFAEPKSLNQGYAFIYLKIKKLNIAKIFIIEMIIEVHNGKIDTECICNSKIVKYKFSGHSHKPKVKI